MNRRIIKIKYIAILYTFALGACGYEVGTNSNLDSINILNTKNLDDAHEQVYVQGDSIYLVDCQSPLLAEPIDTESCSHKMFKHKKMNYQKEFLPGLEREIGEMEVEEFEKRIDVAKTHLNILNDRLDSFRRFEKTSKEFSPKNLSDDRIRLQSHVNNLENRLVPATVREGLFEKIKNQITSNETPFLVFYGSTAADAISRVFSKEIAKGQKREEWKQLDQGIELVSHVKAEGKKNDAYAVPRLHLFKNSENLVKLQPITDPYISTQKIAESSEWSDIQSREINYATEFLPRIKGYLKFRADEELNKEIEKYKKIRRKLSDEISIDRKRAAYIQVDGREKKMLQDQLTVVDRRIEKLQRSVKPQRIRNQFVEEIESNLDAEKLSTLFQGDLKTEAVLHAFGIITKNAH